MNDILREFLLETQENLAQLDSDLIALEKDPSERQILARVFRTLHTVKGTAGFLGLVRLQALSHAAENLLGRLRARELLFNPAMATVLLGTVDAIRKTLASLEATEDEGNFDHSDLIRRLEELLVDGGKASQAAPTPEPKPIEPPLQALSAVQKTAASPTVLQPKSETIQQPVFNLPEAAKSDLDVKVEPGGPLSEPAEVRGPAVADTTIRVDVGLLDKLMNLVGELVLARNQIMQFSASQEDTAFLGTVQRLNLLTTELQGQVMKTRMQPIGTLWGKFPRVVRDLALACNKQVRIEMEGQETELDRTIIEAIRDPLTHMIRNAVDHGIELPEIRQQREKPAEGRITLHAFHESGKVIIQISDDGSGIDLLRVRDKAIANRLVSPEQVARLNERELLNLIFLPGFSTAEQITHFSGRGVGMDVVRTNIEKIGGSVDLETTPGRGTSVRMKIPLTLAIIPALTISCAGDRYAIPQVSLLELVRLDGEQTGQKVEWIQGAPVYRLRGQLLPLVYLDQLLHGSINGSVATEMNIVVLQADDRQFGLVVDAIHDTEEIVVKPLQKQLKSVAAFAGATIMGDGRVALILDVLGIAQLANVLSGTRTRVLSEKTTAQSEESQADRRTVLLFSTQQGERMAMPLALVARLEKFPESQLEQVGMRQMVQYRGQILPLIDVGRELRRLGRMNRRRTRGRRTAAIREKATDPFGHSQDLTQVVVYNGPGWQVGLVVGSILDIVEEEISVRSGSSRPGVLYTAVVAGLVTEFLDVEGIIESAASEFSVRVLTEQESPS